MGIISAGLPKPYEYEVEAQLGNIPQTTLASLNGIISTNSTTYKLASSVSTLIDLPYPYLTSAQQLYISSTNAQDSLTGTGGRVISIYGLDANYAEITEIINMNGTTPVTTTKSYLRLISITVLVYGSNVDALGDRSLNGIIYGGYGTVTDGVPQYKLLAASGSEPRSRTAIITVPKNKYYVTRSISVTNDVAVSGDVFTTAMLAIRLPGFAQWFKSYPLHTYVKNSIPIVPLVFPQYTDIEIRVKNNNAQTQNTVVELIFEGREVLT